MDLIGQLHRIQSSGAAETFDQATDSLEAIRDFLAGVLTDIQGLSYYGTVTGVPGANQFTIDGLSGYGETAFVGWEAYVFWDAGGAGAAPQGETKKVTAYVDAIGSFTTGAFTAAVGIGDIIIILHPSLGDIVFDFNVPAADAVTNILERDVIGNKTDTNAGTSILARHLVPTADVATNVNARDVVGNKTDTVASGSLQGLARAQAADNATTTNARDTVGNKADAAVTVAAAGKSIMAYIKGLLSLHPIPGADAATNTNMRDVLGNKTDTAVATAATSSVINLLRYCISSGIGLQAIFDLVNAILTLMETGGTLTATGAEDTLYLVTTPAGVFKPITLKLDTTNMAAGDFITVRVYERIVTGGALVLTDSIIYGGAQTIPLKDIKFTANRFGISTTLTQTAGVNRLYPWSVAWEG